MDKLALDKHGHLSLEPVHFTLTLFNHKARNQPTAWQPVGYISNLGLQSKAETKNALTGPEKVQLYHNILAGILRQLKTLTMTGIDGFKFRYGDKEHTADLRFFVVVVLGDTKAHGKLGGGRLTVPEPWRPFAVTAILKHHSLTILKHHGITPSRVLSTH
jgi:hypothetical protein